MTRVIVALLAAIAVVVVLGAWANGFEGSRARAAALRDEREALQLEAQVAAAAPVAQDGDAAAGNAAAPPPPVAVDTVVEAPETFAFEGGELETELLGLFTDVENGTVAVVVEVTNPDPARWILGATIQIELLDAAGNVIATNTQAGTDPILNEVPSIPPGGTELYVNDTTAPADVGIEEVAGARVAATGNPSELVPVELEVVNPLLEDGVFGAGVTGSVSNPGAEAKQKVRVDAVVRNAAGTIVGAGQGLVETLEPGARVDFSLFITGESTGELEVWAPAL